MLQRIADQHSRDREETKEGEAIHEGRASGTLQCIGAGCGHVLAYRVLARSWSSRNRCAQQSARARASAASGDRAAPPPAPGPSSSLTILATWTLSARPLPVTADLTSAGLYSAISTPRPASTASSAPRAWAR